jgi:cytochrome d ubiquinol oxidase subunit II
VWEADHVWLILVVVILFYGFPPVFARLMTDLHIPVTLMLIGVVLRGSAFAFRSYSSGHGTRRDWNHVFAIASMVTPLWLGVVVGAIASGRLPANPHGIDDFVFPWLTPFCFMVGAMTVSLFVYLEAIYLTLETDDSDLREDFRRRAIIAAIVAGVIAGVTLLLSMRGAPVIWNTLTTQPWEWTVVWLASVLALSTIYMLTKRRFEAARLCAVVQVGLILWGWIFAQFPNMVEPDMSIYNSAAPHLSIDLLAIALGAGALVLFPSFRYLRKVFKTRPERLEFRHRHYPNSQANQKTGPTEGPATH